PGCATLSGRALRLRRLQMTRRPSCPPASGRRVSPSTGLRSGAGGPMHRLFPNSGGLLNRLDLPGKRCWWICVISARGPKQPHWTSISISGGGHVNGDTAVLDNANALSFDASHTINFEDLRKDNVGVATLTGAQSFWGGTTLNGGALNVSGQLETPTVAMADDIVLQVNGTVQAAGGTSVALSGSAGANTVMVGEGGTLRATGDLGDGNDVLDVAGTLDTGAGSVLLGAGDDTLTIHDNTRIIGTVMAGAGNDTFNADIAGHADLGAVQQFETPSKTGEGVLNVNGPASSDFTTVNALAGTLNVAAGGSIAAQATTAAADATLQVAGSYTGTSGDDSFASRGTVIGALAFGAGNDSVDVIGGNMSGGTALDGGAGTDRLGFSGQTLDGGTLPTL